MRASTTVAVAGAMLALASVVAAQETYPSKAIVMVTHSSPGAGGDLFLRQLGKVLEPILKQPLVVENVRGGASARAVSFVASAKPDGYTLYGSTPTMIQTPLLTRTQHTYKDLKPIANVFFDPMVIYVRNESAHKTLRDLVADAKKHSGKQKWAAATPGSVEHMLIHQIRKIADVQVTPVTFEGGGDALIALLGGNVDAAIGEPQELVSQIEAKQVRVLASFTDERLPGQTYPTAKEEGYGVVVTKFRGLLGPKGLPTPIVRALETAVKQALADAEYRKYYTSVYLQPRYMGSEEYGQYLDKMNADLATYLQEIGVKPKGP